MKKIALLVLLFVCGFISEAYPQTYQYSVIDYPGALWTSANGINNLGHIVGTYSDGTNSHGFFYDGNEYVTIDYPGGPFNYSLQDINDSGKMVGNYNYNGLGSNNGFIFDGQVFTSFSFAGNTETSVNGVNDAGVVAGGYYDWPTNTSNGFLYDNGNFTIFPDTMIFSDVNDSGLIVGYDPDFYTSFLLDENTMTQIIFGDIPFGIDIWALGINDSGYIVGNYYPGGGFIYDGTGYITVNYPGAQWSSINGINDSGHLVGQYSDNNSTHGFVATPVPEPSLFLLFGLSIAGMAMWHILRKSRMIDAKAP